MSKLFKYQDAVFLSDNITAIRYSANWFYVHLVGEGISWHYKTHEEAVRAHDEFLLLWKKAMDGNEKETSLKAKLIKAGLAHWATNPKNGKPKFELIKKEE